MKRKSHLNLSMHAPVENTVPDRNDALRSPGKAVLLEPRMQLQWEVTAMAPPYLAFVRGSALHCVHTSQLTPKHCKDKLPQLQACQ